MFVYVQCDLEVPDGLKFKFSNFFPMIKNFKVTRADIGDYVREYATENNLLKQPQRMLILSWKMGKSILLYSIFISVFVWHAWKFIDLYNTRP